MAEIKEFQEKIVQVNRVSKKTKGGNRIGFSVVVVVGDKKGKVAVGLGKAPDVKTAIQKGVRYAKKHFIFVPLTKTGTIPHDVYLKVGAAKILLRRAPEGTGVIAGGAVRAVVEAAGIRNIVSKVLGTANQASNVYACLEALRRLKPIQEKSMVKNQNSSIQVEEEKSDRVIKVEEKAKKEKAQSEEKKTEKIKKTKKTKIAK